MKKDGPIIIVDDDNDDKEIFEDIFQKLNCPNEIAFFSEPQKALAYLRQPQIHPFLVISDINMCLIDGVQLRSVVQSDKILKKKCAAFILMSSSVSGQMVEDLYARSVQGLFQKPSDFDTYLSTIRKIIDYWQSCLTC